MASIVVCGYMVRHPVAGNILAFFSYLLGLHRLGHRVVYLEESGWPYSCYDPARRTYTEDPGEGLRRVKAFLAANGIDIPVYYAHRDTGVVTGGHREEVERALREADLLLNVGGVCWLPEFEICSRLALVDMDPLFTQAGRFGTGELGRYNACFTYGVNIGQPGCSVPTGGADWLPTVPPVIPEMWEWASPRDDAPFTTIANWSAYGSITYEGERYGQKDQEFVRVIDLPVRVSQPVELALSGADIDVVSSFRSSGWLVRDAGEVSDDVSTYHAYIQGSRGEFSAAKHAYVKTRSGWFSDRSVCYLASGLPVVLQDTGFSDWLPAGRGALAFSSLQEAADCIKSVSADYESHRRAAREIAEQVFGYERVLPGLVDVALGAPAHSLPRGGGAA